LPSISAASWSAVAGDGSSAVEQQDAGVAHQVGALLLLRLLAEPGAVERQQRPDPRRIRTPQAHGAQALEVMQCPDHAAGAEVQRVDGRQRIGVVVFVVGIARVDGPLPLRRKRCLRVAHDPLDRGQRTRFVPGGRAQRLVSCGVVEHGAGVCSTSALPAAESPGLHALTGAAT
jgi:hypothetical protein